MLDSTGVKVTIIENDRERGNQLAELLQYADVDCGDGTDTMVLARNSLQNADGFVALPAFFAYVMTTLAVPALVLFSYDRS